MKALCARKSPFRFITRSVAVMQFTRSKILFLRQKVRAFGYPVSQFVAMYRDAPTPGTVRSGTSRQ